uniref:Uncharacterized protein n=1 Tax=Mycobacterium phage Pharb TaxID=3136626 RepID=A0AAU8GSL8_9VIRU
MSESTSGVQCHVCGLYDARVFDPCGAMWCRVCDLMGLGDLAVREKVEEIAEGVGKAFDAAVLFDPRNTIEWGEPQVPNYGAINRVWREQMGKAADGIPTADEVIEAVDEINSQLRSGADDGVRVDLMGKLGALLAEGDTSTVARTWLPGDADDADLKPGRLYTIPEPPQVSQVTVPGVVTALGEAHKAFVWEDVNGAHWGWAGAWVAWNTAPYRVGVGAVGPFRPVFMRPDVDLGTEQIIPERAGDPAIRLPGGAYCCGGGGNPGGHEWNCDLLTGLGRYSKPAGEASTCDDAKVSEPEGDAVAHPSHYTSSPAHCSGCGKPIECIDVTQHMGFNLGNTTKYVWRCDLKRDAIEDLRKARQYLDFEIEKRERALVDQYKNRNTNQG